MPNGDCLFCQIISGEIPATKVYEDDKILAILDIHPVNPGHTLVMPKKHFTHLLETDEETATAMILATKKIALGVINGLNLDAFNLELNNGRIAGQIVPHLHWHIVPRMSDDGLQHWPGKSYRAGEAEEIAKKIRENIR
ncbi:HIT family protein [Candidatus Falkowbacteria bacterium]|nr:HIT family protein [Candidatus Falkowbacteria bacterium]